MCEIQSVIFEHHQEPNTALPTSRPRISWTFTGDAEDWLQTAYELEVKIYSYPKPPTTENFHIKSSDSVLVPWLSEPLQCGERVNVRVRAKGGVKSAWTDWSEPATAWRGPFKREHWIADLIAAPRTINENGSLRPALFRKEFKVKKDILSARLYITSYGLYEAYINGKRVGSEVLAPGWTSYRHRLLYQSFDVSDLLQDGENVIGVEVGDGWYCGRLGFNGGWRCIYGDKLALLAQLEVTFPGGETLRVLSDGTWKTSVGPTISSELYDGEIYDANQEVPGWSSPSFKDEIWGPVEPLAFPTTELLSPEGPPVRQIETVQPIEILKSPTGKVILDFGQNLVGRLRVKASGPKNHIITFKHVEVLEYGEISMRPLRDAKPVDTLILSGTSFIWEPKFTSHGFRYVEVDNWPSFGGEPALSDIEAVVIHTDMKQTGFFECSNAMVNRLHENIRWGMKGNFVSLPTDCPQRDERLGWTGDIQIFSPTASFLYNTTGMLSSWLKDLAVEQIKELNDVPGVVVPNILPSGFTTPQAAWSDAAIIVPWDLYQSSGDIQILSTQYESMKAWLEKGIPRQPSGLWNPNYDQLGDWLDPDALPNEPGNGKTDPQFVANAYLVHITDLMAKISGLLDEKKDEEHYTREAARLKYLFQYEYVTPAGRLAPDTQTSLSLAITFHLFSEPSHYSFGASRLSNLVRRNRFRIGTGFVGTPILLPSLSAHGYDDVAYRMLVEESLPSWMYPITMGATTMWERWDSMLPDGRVNPGSMTSFNHYALGSVGNWLHGTVGGISPAQPSWKVVRIAPVPGGDLNWCITAFEGPYGRVSCEWKIDDRVGEEGGKSFVMNIEVPPNCTAQVKLPGVEKVESVGSGRREFSCLYTQGVWPPQAILSPFDQDDDGKSDWIKV